MKIIFTPPCGSFKESYEKRRKFRNIDAMIEYLIEYDDFVFNKKSIKEQYFIEWYGYNKKLERDRFIILFKDYKKNPAERYPVGFFHYEEKI